jgi:ligand-binding sensor protein
MYLTHDNSTTRSKHVNLASIRLQDVIDIEFLQRFQDDFASGVGLASVTVDPDGNPVTKPSRYIRRCKDFTQSTVEGKQRCAESHRKGGLIAAQTGKPAIYECHSGLVDFAAPIMIDGRIVGTILGGQIVTEPIPESKTRNYAKEIGVLNVEEYVASSRETRVLTKEAIASAANVLFIVANSMAQSAYQQLKLQAAATNLAEEADVIASAMEQLSCSAAQVNGNQMELNKEIQGVNMDTGKIDEVTELITKIADQINLLGINASIEAARAGAMGLGFGVVAKEISILSKDSKNAVGRIKTLTSTIQQSVENTVVRGNQTTSSIKEQSSVIEKVTSNVHEITSLIQHLNELAILSHDKRNTSSLGDIDMAA